MNRYRKKGNNASTDNDFNKIAIGKTIYLIITASYIFCNPLIYWPEHHDLNYYYQLSTLGHLGVTNLCCLITTPALF